MKYKCVIDLKESDILAESSVEMSGNLARGLTEWPFHVRLCQSQYREDADMSLTCGGHFR